MKKDYKPGELYEKNRISQLKSSKKSLTEKQKLAIKGLI